MSDTGANKPNGRCPTCGRVVVAQKYYGAPELAWLFGFSEWSIREWGKQGKFGPPSQFLRVGNDVRIPQSGVLFFIEAHLNAKSEARRLADQVRGRTLGEARRKLAAIPSPDV